jgi:hypothetical protein
VLSHTVSGKQNSLLEFLTEFRLPWWFILDVGSVLWSMDHVDVSSVADVSGVHAASIFTVKVDRVDESSCMYRFLVQQNHRRKR